mgnify:FL=1
MEEKKWFLYVVDHHEGPFSLSEIQSLVKKGDAKSSSYVWREGFEDWMMMSEVSEFGVAGPSGEGHGPAAFILGKKESPVLFSPRSSDASVGGPLPIAHQGNVPDISGISETAVVWCLNSNRTFTGPHSLRTITRLINEGKATSKDTIWKEGWTGFVPISSFSEFMVRIHDGASQKNKVSSAQALGMMRSGMGIKRRFSFGGILKWLVLAFLVFGGFYQVTAMGLFNPVFEKIGILETVRRANLKPVPVPKIVIPVEYISDAGNFLRRQVEPLLAKYSDHIPGPILEYLSVVELPEGLNEKDEARLRDAATANPDAGRRAAAALIGQEVMNPRFVLASNIDGSSFRVVLRGKEGTLLNASEYVSEQVVTLRNRVAISQPFYLEDTKSLPQGEYTFTVLNGEESVLIENAFLGGENDSAYQDRLKEFNARMAAWRVTKAQEILQITNTLESLANESAAKFFALNKMRPGTARVNEWRKYSAKYRKISDQLALAIGRTAGEIEKSSFRSVAASLKAGLNLSEELHHAQNAYLGSTSPGNVRGEDVMASVRNLAGQLVAVITKIKTAVAKPN